MKVQSRAGVMVFLLLLASCFLFVCYTPTAYAGPQPKGPDVPTEAEQALFTKGQTLYTQGLYGEAIAIFNEFLTSYPNSSIKDLNLLWLGRSYLRAGDIASAERMGLRLREITDTPLAGMYEEELRIARQGYVKSASPAFVRRNDVAPVIAPSEVTSLTPGTVILTPKGSASPPTPAKSQNAPLSSNPARLLMSTLSLTPVKATSSRSPSPANAVAPLLRIRVEEMSRVAAANGVVFYRLVLANAGNGAAKDLILREELDSSLDFASSDPAPGRQEIVARTLLLTFRLASLEPGASRSIRIAVRPRPDAKANTPTVKTATQTKHSVTYRDSKGNTYHTP